MAKKILAGRAIFLLSSPGSLGNHTDMKTDRRVKNENEEQISSERENEILTEPLNVPMRCPTRPSVFNYATRNLPSDSGTKSILVGRESHTTERYNRVKDPTLSAGKSDVVVHQNLKYDSKRSKRERPISDVHSETTLEIPLNESEESGQEGELRNTSEDDWVGEKIKAARTEAANELNSETRRGQGIKSLSNTDRGHYCCEICGKELKYFSIFVKHFRSHTGERPFECPTCHQKFSQEDNLKQHSSVHTGECPFECDICHKRFRLKKFLRQHMSYHGKERPFECSYCPKKFPLQYMLKRHTKIHTCALSFQCPLCPKKFKLKYKLTRHTKIHTRDLSFQCPFCSKKFKNNSVMTRHMTVHTRERPFKCSYCPRDFPQKCNLIAHIKWQHLKNQDKKEKQGNEKQK